MSEDAQARPRTITRLRAEVPPGMSHGDESRQAIGRYEIVKTIGKGAMGVVYKARDPLLDRIVAVKTITSPQQQGRRVRSAFIERFQREAKAAAKMSHPAIVTIFDVGVDEESGSPFMVLEYLPGESLADRLDRVRLPLSRCVQIGLDLASALSFAHRQRIIHRDVKPANVLHAGDNRWKLADFGIARMPDSDLTQVGIFMGTPGYSPPEAIREGRYTPQADVFAWGALMYELLSGRIPYEGPDTKTTNSYVLQGNAPSPARHDPSIPEPLAAVVMQAIEPADKRRFKDASEAEQALREAWDRCLMHGIIQPAVLALDEITHERAPVRMHEAKGFSVAPKPTADPAIVGVSEFGDSQEITTIDKAPELPPPLVVESAQRGIDNDPTTLLPLEPSRPEKSAIRSSIPLRTPEGVLRTPAQPGLSIHLRTPEGVLRNLAEPGASKAVPAGPAPAQRDAADRRLRLRAPRPTVVLIAVVLFIGAVALGLYLAGVLG